MKDPMAVAVGGASGALARFALIELVAAGAFPCGTLCVNLLGAVLVAVLHVLDQKMPHRLKLFSASGFAGSFTTVSLFSHDLVSLLQSGTAGSAAAYFGLTLIPALPLAFCIILSARGRKPGA